MKVFSLSPTASPTQSTPRRAQRLRSHSRTHSLSPRRRPLASLFKTTPAARLPAHHQPKSNTP